MPCSSCFPHSHSFSLTTRIHIPVPLWLHPIISVLHSVQLRSPPTSQSQPWVLFPSLLAWSVTVPSALPCSIFKSNFNSLLWLLVPVCPSTYSAATCLYSGLKALLNPVSPLSPHPSTHSIGIKVTRQPVFLLSFLKPQQKVLKTKQDNFSKILPKPNSPVLKHNQLHCVDMYTLAST